MWCLLLVLLLCDLVWFGVRCVLCVACCLLLCIVCCLLMCRCGGLYVLFVDVL